MITRIIYFPLNLSSVYIKNWETENKKRRDVSYPAWENFLFFFFLLSFFLSIFIYLFHRIVIHVILSVIRLSCSSRFFFFHFIYFYFYSILFPFVSSCPPLFPRIFVIPYPLVCIFVARPRPLPLKKIREKKNASLFIALTDRTFAKSSRYHVKFLSPRSFNAHPRREFPRRSSSDFLFIYLIFLLYF